MKYALFAAILLLFGCKQKETLKTFQPQIRPLPAQSIDLVRVAGPMFHQGFKDLVDLSQVESFISKENLIIYMAPFKTGNDKWYAACNRGELIYVRRGEDIIILRQNEGVRITGREIISLEAPEFKYWLTQNFNPEDPNDPTSQLKFCQRKQNENYGSCYNRVSENFCTSFASCVLKDLHPAIPIMIGLSCSCYEDARKQSKPGDTAPLPDSPIFDPFDPSKEPSDDNPITPIGDSIIPINP